jgi:uncharacterized membrane protein
MSDLVHTSDARSRRTVFLVLLIATILKMAWAWTSAGSVDVVLFFNFARAIEEYGLVQVYGLDSIFNHTPLTGGLVYGLYKLSGADVLTFASYLRMLPILADVMLVMMLVRFRHLVGKPPWWALTLFAASPVSLMVSGFHGNVDSVMTAMFTGAALATMAGRPILSGVLLGLACNVKVVPLPFAPVFFFYWWGKGAAWRFTIANVLVLLAGAAWPLLTVPREFLKNVLGYGSSWGVWGVTYWIQSTGWEAVQKVGFRNLSPEQVRIALVLKIMLVCGIAMIGWRRRNVSSHGFIATLAAAWTWFFIVASGVAAQYFVWPAPFLLLAIPRAYAVLTATSTLMLVTFYHTASRGRIPWFFANPMEPDVPAWSAIGTLSWVAFVSVFVIYAREWWTPREESFSRMPVAPALA